MKLPSIVQGGRIADLGSLSPPSFFVGHEGYPKVNIGPMLPHSLDTPFEPTIIDAPERWFTPGVAPSERKSISDIVTFRSNLIRTTHAVNVKSMDDNPLLKISQEIAMAEKPVATEVSLEKIRFRIQLGDHSPPNGPSGKIEKIRLTENPKIHAKVDYVVGDTDLKASDAIYDYLYKDAHLPVNDVHRILSAGLLGKGENRKLVPTRWAITAVDDTISKRLIKKIKDFQEVGEYMLHESEYLGNSFHVLLAPRPWMYEMMECWDPRSIWRALEGSRRDYIIVQDHELNKGRKKYASNVTGAYYAARLGVAEYLTRIRRQAAVVVIREVNEQYLMPLGVWVIRQTVRDAMMKKPKRFSSLAGVFRYLERVLSVPLKYWLKKSVVLHEMKRQKTLNDFLR